MELLVVGSIALDTVETPDDRREEVLGGSACYVAVAASRFARTGIIAVVGDDFPTRYTELLERSGVDTSGLGVQHGRTFRWSGRYHRNMNQRDTLSTELGVFEDFDPVFPARARSARALFLGNIDPALQLEVLEQAGSARLVGLDTMNYWIDGTPETLARVLRRVDILLINDEEARSLAGEHNLRAAARAIFEMGPRYLVIKRGEYGALLLGKDELFSVPALLLDEVHDPTGAGDSFAGGFMGYLAKVGELSPSGLRQAMLMGTVTASFAVQDFSLDGLLSLDQPAFDARYHELLRMVQV